MLLFILCFHSLSGFIEALFQLASKVVLAVHIQFLADMAALAGDVRFTLVQFDADFLQHLTFQYHLADHPLTVGKVGTYQIPSLLAQFVVLQLFCGTVQDFLLLFGDLRKYSLAFVHCTHKLIMSAKVQNQIEYTISRT